MWFWIKPVCLKGVSKVFTWSRDSNVVMACIWDCKSNFMKTRKCFLIWVPVFLNFIRKHLVEKVDSSWRWIFLVEKWIPWIHYFRNGETRKNVNNWHYQFLTHGGETIHLYLEKKKLLFTHTYLIFDRYERTLLVCPLL